MSSTYCPNCGYKNEYSGARPKTCASCGEPFDKIIAAIVSENIKKQDAQSMRFDGSGGSTEDAVIETHSSLGIAFDEGSLSGSRSEKMTVESVRQNKDGLSFDRGKQEPEISELRREAQKILVGEAMASAPAIKKPRKRKGSK